MIASASSNGIVNTKLKLGSNNYIIRCNCTFQQTLVDFLAMNLHSTVFLFMKKISSPLLSSFQHYVDILIPE